MRLTNKFELIIILINIICIINNEIVQFFFLITTWASLLISTTALKVINFSALPDMAILRRHFKVVIVYTA